MRQDKRVLHIIDSFGTGGAETWLLATTKYLHEHKELGYSFDFLLSGGHEGVFDKQVRLHGSKLFYLKYSISGFWKFRKQFRKILREGQYDAIHDHQDFISGWHFLLGLGLLPKFKISHVHNPFNFVKNYVKGPVRWLSFKMGRRLMVGLTDSITGTSNAVMDEYGYDKMPFRKKRILPAYCGFDVERFSYCKTAKEELSRELNWRPDTKIALFVGRIGLNEFDTAENQKNPEFALAVARHLVSLDPDWRFLMVGHKGKIGNELESAIQEEGLGDKIKFLGLRNDVPKIMSASDVMIFPSLWEGLGMVAVEAQASGLRCIISEAVPLEAVICPDLVRVKPLADGAESWAKEIVSLDRSKGNERKSYAGEILHSPYSIENSVNYLLSLYH